MIMNIYKIATLISSVATVKEVATGISFTDFGGTVRTLYTGTDSYYALRYTLGHCVPLVSNGSSTIGVVFGDGNTPPTGADTTLAGSLIENLTITAAARNENIDGGLIGNCVYTITNNNDNAVTIREIGVVGGVYRGKTSVGVVLIERTVLDTPVTIEAGGVGQITYRASAEW